MDGSEGDVIFATKESVMELKFIALGVFGYCGALWLLGNLSNVANYLNLFFN